MTPTPPGPPGPPAPETAPETPKYSEYIIDKVMPKREVHLIVGPAGIGKTTLLYEWHEEFRLGGLLFGYRVFPTPMVFISCDRSRSAHYRRLDSLGIPHESIPFFSARDTREGATSIDNIFAACMQQFPHHHLYYIDAFATLVPGNLSSYPDVWRLLTHTGKLCEMHDKTVLGSLHTAKTKEGEAYLNPRERVLGSAAWGGFADLMLVLSEERSPTDKTGEPASVRRLDVLSRAPAGDFALRYKLDKAQNNRFVLWEPEDDYAQDLLSLMDVWLSGQPADRPISTREIIQYGAKATLSERSVERWLAQAVQEGRLAKPAKGLYQRLRAQ